MTAPLPRLLNLGCGRRFHPAWTNADVNPVAPCVMQCDLRQPLPFASASFDAVYHSHVLEHLEPDSGRRLMHECRRVLQPAGVLRVVVPDLENICRTYLAAVEDVVRVGDARAHSHHQWMTAELLDQLVRHTSGGNTAQALRRGAFRDMDFVRSRLGAELDAVLSPGPPPDRSLRQRLRSAARLLVGTVAGEGLVRALQVGRFRLQGEAHQWMYDRISLAALFQDAGLVDPHVTSATSSALEGWPRYHLDADAQSRPHKPDSLFMEGQVPA
jgi:predicted SAM-dependent methyltransferase